MITSTSNQKIKRLVTLKKKRKARDEEEVFLVEGSRMFKELPKELLKEIYVSEEFYKKEKEAIEELQKKSKGTLELLSDHVLQYVADTKTPQGVLCIVKQRKEIEIKRLIETQEPLLLILDNVQDPGNLGTILRTAEGAGVTGIVMSKDCVDIYNPKTIRSTMGSVYRLPFFITEDIIQTIQTIKKAGILVYAAHLEGAQMYDTEDYKRATAFMIGNEGNGLREVVSALADTNVKIPMEGEVESLNAAIAAAILMFEVSRQRRHR